MTTPASGPRHRHYARSPRVHLGNDTEGGQRGGQASSLIAERRRRRKLTGRQMDQQMVAFRLIPEDDRAEGQTQRMSKWQCEMRTA